MARRSAGFKRITVLTPCEISYLKNEDDDEDQHHSGGILVSAGSTRRHESSCSLDLDPDGTISHRHDAKGADLEHADDLTEKSTQFGTHVGQAPGNGADNTTQIHRSTELCTDQSARLPNSYHTTDTLPIICN